MSDGALAFPGDSVRASAISELTMDDMDVGSIRSNGDYSTRDEPFLRIQSVTYKKPRILRSLSNAAQAGLKRFVPESAEPRAMPLSYQVDLGNVQGGTLAVNLGSNISVAVDVPRVCDGLPRQVWADLERRLIATFRMDGPAPGKGAIGISLGLGFCLGLDLPAGKGLELSMKDLLFVLLAVQLADIAGRLLWREYLYDESIYSEIRLVLLRVVELIFGLALGLSLIRPRLERRIKSELNSAKGIKLVLQVEKIQRAGVELPPVSKWPDRPVIARGRPACTLQVTPRAATQYYPSAPMPPDPISLCVNVAPYDFETPLFKGSLIVRVRGLPTTQEEYFAGRNRRMQVCLQGRFKRRTRFDKVFSGQEFSKPLAWTPSRPIVSTCFTVLSPVLPPTFKYDVFSERPYFLSPLLCTCQGFAVERPGEQQDVFGVPEKKWAIDENTALLNDPDVPKNGDKRRKYFGVQRNLEKFYFEPGLVYTFDYYQHYFDATQMTLDLSSLLKFDATRILGNQALQVSMAKDITTNEYIWNFDMMHEKLVTS